MGSGQWNHIQTFDIWVRWRRMNRSHAEGTGVTSGHSFPRVSSPRSPTTGSTPGSLRLDDEHPSGGAMGSHPNIQHLGPVAADEPLARRGHRGHIQTLVPTGVVAVLTQIGRAHV